MDFVSIIINSAIRDVLSDDQRRKRKGNGHNIKPINYDALRVGTLRTMIHSKGLRHTQCSRYAIVEILKFGDTAAMCLET